MECVILCTNKFNQYFLFLTESQTNNKLMNS